MKELQAYDKIRELISNGNTEEALEFLLELSENTDEYNSVLLMSARFARIKNRFQKGVITGYEHDSELTRINITMLSLVYELLLKENNSPKQKDIKKESTKIHDKLSDDIESYRIEIDNLLKNENLVLGDNVFTSRVLKGDNRAIIDLYTELAESEETELYEARLLIIGEPRTGKTTLQRKLKNITADLPRLNESTKGISSSNDPDIEVYKNSFECKNLNGKNVQFFYNIWDFGGQRQYHPTHQLFFAQNALYILLTNTDWNKNEEDVEFWLSTVKKLGIESPVIRVQNMPNDRSDESDWSLVNQVYGDMIKGVFSINLSRINKNDRKKFNNTDYSNFKKLEKAIQYELTNLKHVGSTVPKVWVEIRESLTKIKNHPPYITWAEFVKICEKHNYKDSDRQLRLSQTFHDLGIFLHYQRNPLLKQIVILDNKWAIDAVFEVIDNDIITQKKGVFTEKDLPRIWSKPKFKGKEQELLSLLKDFELCYPLINNKGYVAPQKLLKAPPTKYKWDDTNNVKVDIEYDFLPRTVITRLIVKLHTHIAEEKDWVWQNGVVISGKLLKLPNTYAWIQENHKKKTLEIKLNGNYSEELFHEIKSKLFDIYEDFPPLEGDYVIYCNCNDCKSSNKPTKFKYHGDLLHYRRELKRDEIECKTKGKLVSISSILTGLLSETKVKEDLENVPRKGDIYIFKDNSTFTKDSTKIGIMEQNNPPQPPSSVKDNAAIYGYLSAVIIVGGVLFFAFTGLTNLKSLLFSAVLVLMVVIVGALQLRNDDRLSEKSFGEIIAMILKKIPPLSWFGKKES